jgi:hypothetical protein
LATRRELSISAISQTGIPPRLPLEADTVDRHRVVPELVDHIKIHVWLRLHARDVLVAVVQVGTWLGGGTEAKSIREMARTDVARPGLALRS